jgi:hypothetical protein
MSQSAVVMACQIPFKFGLPSPIRGILAAAVCPAAGNTETNAATHTAAPIEVGLKQNLMGWFSAN